MWSLEKKTIRPCLQASSRLDFLSTRSYGRKMFFFLQYNRKRTRLTLNESPCILYIIVYVRAETGKITHFVCTTTFQVLINGVWMVLKEPRAVNYYPNRESNILVCSYFTDTSFVIAFGYPIMLIVVCTVYAVLTRNIPEAFNESKHIGKRLSRSPQV